ncbi:pathogenesis-related protein PRB1-2 [Physcomitrium patens]|uniref:SCP domain-containing protein n=1 Tax=Physcomitrium patens TaxID=3218 RepID=A0A2K1ID82_PHYPA|nr:pathogenesis-related protein PRB1-2-like [Physcomitrium patens]PNR27227.1 hypothetical protein PHYPA_029379 [Physcomitrium patens]|eukprot:XP_024365166.1 pathogenesis-related protein PRB1-2-like [Physcomitrella patens]
MGAFEGLKPWGRKIVVIIALTVFADMIFFAAAQSSVAVQQEFLTPHNNARKDVGVDALVWSKELEDYARSYAQSQRDSCLPLTHSNGNYGENLFWGSGQNWTPFEAVTAWNDEKVDYNYNTNTCAPNKVCGHYTQVVWNTTTHVGCASEMCSDDGIYIICSYDPPGNWIGEKPH